jgi:hypothetical protein
MDELCALSGELRDEERRQEKMGKKEKTTADPYGMTTKGTGNGNSKGKSNRRSLRDDNKKDEQRYSKEVIQEDRPTGPYIEALVNPS